MFIVSYDVHYRDFHDCPPQGQWAQTWADLYGRVFTHAKPTGIMLGVEHTEQWTVCGDLTNEFNGVYTKKSEYRYTKGEFSEGTARELYFDSKNKIWVLMEPVYRGATEGMGRYYSNSYWLYSSTWKFSKNGPMKGHSYLPGDVESNENDWEDAPLSMAIVNSAIECPYSPIDNVGDEPVIPAELFLCGQNCAECTDTFGRYELRRNGGFPYYQFVGELTEPDSNLVIWYDESNLRWVISFGRFM